MMAVAPDFRSLQDFGSLGERVWMSCEQDFEILHDLRSLSERGRLPWKTLEVRLRAVPSNNSPISLGSVVGYLTHVENSPRTTPQSIRSVHRRKPDLPITRDDCPRQGRIDDL